MEKDFAREQQEGPGQEAIAATLDNVELGARLQALQDAGGLPDVDYMPGDYAIAVATLRQAEPVDDWRLF